MTGTATPPSKSVITAVPGAFRDGGLEFVVTDISENRLVGDPEDPGLSVTAQGVFVVITLSIRNLGSATVTFLDRDQSLIDAAGTRFSTDMAADIYGNLDVHSTRMSPGHGLVVRLAFDVPVDTVPRTLLLRESETSAGVAVPLP
ncbi:MAG: DUF4352 domain-containing protein [Mycobacterium sp.]|nr:DUF4352 domain-containing protein [Mycobacterium sp.]